MKAVEKALSGHLIVMNVCRIAFFCLFSFESNTILAPNTAWEKSQESITANIMITSKVVAAKCLADTNTELQLCKRTLDSDKLSAAETL